jgi:Spy/CpxP family protein refolding chaperone
MDYKVKSYVMLSIIFMLGFMAGMLVKDLITESPLEQIRHFRESGGFISRLENDLDLTNEQKEKIKPLLDKYNMHLQVLVQSGNAFFHTSLDSLKEELKPYLNKEQIKKLDQQFPMPPMPGMLIDNLENDLQLTDKQKEKLKPIFEKYKKHFLVSLQPRIITFRSPFDSLKEEIKPYLTKEQIKKLNEVFMHPFPPGAEFGVSTSGDFIRRK